eukprot:SAG11_NODE_1447_length_4888_cov_2.819795_2_plen_148_part_00
MICNARMRPLMSAVFFPQLEVLHFQVTPVTTAMVINLLLPFVDCSVSYEHRRRLTEYAQQISIELARAAPPCSFSAPVLALTAIVFGAWLMTGYFDEGMHDAFVSLVCAEPRSAAACRAMAYSCIEPNAIHVKVNATIKVRADSATP